LTDTDLFVLGFVGPIFRFTMTGPEAVDAASGTQVANTSFGSGGLEVDGTSLLWGIAGEGKVATCEAPSCSLITDFLTGAGSPAGVSVTAGGVFWADRGTSNGQGGFVAGTGSVRVVRR